jgi:hypothetical protein
LISITPTWGAAAAGPCAEAGPAGGAAKADELPEKRIAAGNRKTAAAKNAPLVPEELDEYIIASGRKPAGARRLKKKRARKIRSEK